MQYLSQLSSKTKPWLLLAFSALAIELCALFFQYLMDLAPCIMCVYQRLAIFAIVLAGIIGASGHQFLLFRIVAYALWAIGAVWGLLLALEHVEMQSATLSFFFSCEITPNFPSWAPLHQWFPAMFEASGDCGKVSWQFLGYSMPQWMVVVYGAYTFAFLVVFTSRVFHTRRL